MIALRQGEILAVSGFHVDLPDVAGIAGVVGRTIEQLTELLTERSSLSLTAVTSPPPGAVAGLHSSGVAGAERDMRERRHRPAFSVM